MKQNSMPTSHSFTEIVKNGKVSRAYVNNITPKHGNLKLQTSDHVVTELWEEHMEEAHEVACQILEASIEEQKPGLVGLLKNEHLTNSQ